MMSVAEIMAAVRVHPVRHIVLTGGEPMMAKGIHGLAAELRKLDYHITIETAATIAPDGIACDLASLSPKLKNSAPDERLDDAWRKRHESLRWQPEVVHQWLAHGGYQLKFVVSQPEDMNEIETRLAQLGGEIPKSKILLMPEGVTTEALRTRAGWLSELCRQRGYRYAPRLHIELYGNKRGT